MSDNMDKELDEIMGLINREHPQRSPRPTQGKPVARRTPRYSQPIQPPRYTLSENERLRRRSKRIRQQQIRKWAIIGGAVVLLLLIIILIFKGCAGGDVLKGTWDMDGTTVYQFEGNGEGAMILPSNTYTFKYTINEEEKTVSIDFEDEKANDYTYNYEVTKDKLILSGSEGKESFAYEFTKTKEK